jgi:tRNA (mo5U34)-methyltransferase
MVQLCSLDRHQMIYPTADFLTDFGLHAIALRSAAQSFLSKPNARTQVFESLLKQLPAATPSRIDLNQDWVTIGSPTDLTADQMERLTHVLIGLKPWRKGPFDLFGIRIDSEWNSALKWRRITPHIKPIQNRKVLDVGSSNGYYLFRMAESKPRLILGIEPYLIYYYQFLALQRYLDLHSVYCLPLKLEDLPAMNQWFDTIFCMGILYHRRSPLDTLSQMNSMLANGGQLILETLIVPGLEDTALFPRDRYARMRNVFFLPTVNCLQNWLERCGFKRHQCVDITPTTATEQRKTTWIDSESLDACLDPRNEEQTVEGYPAPIRAVIVADKKSL